MKVLLCHNFYQQPGGEDHVFADEGRLLELHGHEVQRFALHNDAVATMSSLRLAAGTVWNSASYTMIRDHVIRFRPDVVHFHNTFPLISPAGYYAARLEQAAVVQTLHNYRLACPNALFFRDGRICEECLGKGVPWPGVMHGCYRGNRSATAAAVTMLTVHRAARTWAKAVDAYVALTGFARAKFIEAGLPAGKVHVKPNFVHPDPGVGTGAGAYAIFVGRLSPEKGLGTLLAAWKKLSGAIRLKIVGDGPMGSQVRQLASELCGVECLGQRPLHETRELVGGAMFLIFPSEWYETFGLVAIEAFSKGTPVLASDLGAMAELVHHGRTGLLFACGSADGLAEAARGLAEDAAKLAKMRGAARAEFEAKYTANQNSVILEAVYRAAITARGQQQA